MISDDDITALVGATHTNAYAHLGMHHDSAGALWVRALLPGARAVRLIEASTGAQIAPLQLRHNAGLFEVEVIGRREKFAYRFEIDWASGATGRYADAFSFAPEISDDDLYYLGEGSHLRPFTVLGAHLRERQLGSEAVSGVRFAVWAPNARRVNVVGDFNSWDGRRHPMRLCGPGGQSGIWEIFVPHIGLGERYKFEIIARHGAILPLKADPYARAAELRPRTASVVAPMPTAKSLLEARAVANDRHQPISIYEVHLASWRRRGEAYPTWQALADELPAYVKDLGFTHIELMPVGEYPFDGSWGYQTLGMYAPTARFGEAAGFEYFVERCHAMGIGVLVDWVPAHFPSDAHGLAQFDGTALYEYADPREGFHRDWNTLIYNYDRREVRAFLVGSALYWTERFAIDGLRVDAVASMLYRDYSREDGEWVPNVHGGRENIEAIDFIRRVNDVIHAEVPAALTVAEESTAFAGVTIPPAYGGLGFNFKWNMGWMNDTLRYMQEESINRKWHHDKMTFGLIYAFSENFILPISHDEVVHGKGSMLAKMPGDDWQKFANLRAYYGFMWGHPGKKLLFMGQELAPFSEWDHQQGLPWYLSEHQRHARVTRLVRDLNQLYAATPALYQWDCDARGFQWLVGDDREQSVFAWQRRDADGNTAIVVSNFTPQPRQGYRIGVPDGVTRWRMALDTDAGEYGGSGFCAWNTAIHVDAIGAHGRMQSIVLDLPPLATIFLVPA